MTDINKLNTKDRLVLAAGRLFAEKGFKATTVREIAEAAEANVAAVNYYFGDKEKLYDEIVGHMLAEIKTRYPSDLGQRPSMTAAEKLRTYMLNFLLRRMDPDREAWKGKFFAQEMQDPRPATVEAINQLKIEDYGVLQPIIAEAMGPDAPPEKVALCAASVVSQGMLWAMMHGHQAPAYLREEPLKRERIEEIADHIAEFSMAALKTMGKSYASKAPGKGAAATKKGA